MSNEEINEKYGIELIGKEMWVWDNDPKRAFFTLVILRRMNQLNYPYKAVDGTIFRNASEINPNDPKQPQVGDLGYFWDEEYEYIYSKLRDIDPIDEFPYLSNLNTYSVYFSHEKQPWMK
jgi:hypothetical protein